MNVHELIWDSTRTDLLAVVDYDLGGFDDSAFWRGTPIENPSSLSEVKLYIDDDLPHSDVVGNPLSWQIVSGRFKTHIESLVEPGCVQFLPVALRKKSASETIHDFYVMNVLKHLPALDREKSVFTATSDGMIEYVTKCVVQADRLDQSKIFRLSECPDSIYFSDDLAHSLDGSDMRGIAFICCSVSN